MLRYFWLYLSLSNDTLSVVALEAAELEITQRRSSRVSETVQSAEAERAGLLGVTFLDLNTNETARFAVPGDITLQRAWDMAYDELGEVKRPGDILEVLHTGQPLTDDLDKTVRYAKDHLAHDLRFQIHGEKGGA
jgi:hypothetical protein